jgi:hypothetical protein
VIAETFSSFFTRLVVSAECGRNIKKGGQHEKIFLPMASEEALYYREH